MTPVSIMSPITMSIMSPVTISIMCLQPVLLQASGADETPLCRQRTTMDKTRCCSRV